MELFGTEAFRPTIFYSHEVSANQGPECSRNVWYFEILRLHIFESQFEVVVAWEFDSYPVLPILIRTGGGFLQVDVVVRRRWIFLLLFLCQRQRGLLLHASRVSQG